MDRERAVPSSIFSIVRDLTVCRVLRDSLVLVSKRRDELPWLLKLRPRKGHRAIVVFGRGIQFSRTIPRRRTEKRVSSPSRGRDLASKETVHSIVFFAARLRSSRTARFCLASPRIPPRALIELPLPQISPRPFIFATRLSKKRSPILPQPHRLFNWDGCSRHEGKIDSPVGCQTENGQRRAVTRVGLPREGAGEARGWLPTLNRSRIVVQRDGP